MYYILKMYGVNMYNILKTLFKQTENNVKTFEKH